MNSLHQAVGRLSMRKEPLPFDIAEIVRSWYQASIPLIEVLGACPPRSEIFLHYL